MRGKIFSIPTICLLFAISVLSACSKDDIKPETDPREHYWWGYFNGTFDGTLPIDDLSVSFENDRFHTRTSSHYEFIRPTTAGDDLWNIGIVNTAIEYIEKTDSTDGSYIVLSISGLFPGTKYVTKSFRYPSMKLEDLYYSTITLVRRYLPDSEPVEYVPMEDNPFKIEILDVKWVSPTLPVVEAKLDGVLYRKDALQKESIIINAVYGAGFGM